MGDKVPTMGNLYDHKIEILDLTDFCGAEDCELISEDGIEVLMRHSYAMSRKGWEFVECGRQEDNLCIFHLHYQKEQTLPT
jgi:hypothetical protein